VEVAVAVAEAALVAAEEPVGAMGVAVPMEGAMARILGSAV
jgi:hypothetical protein